ncbi:tetratricopeptide repeat protein [Pseudolysobacter antarcticus]|uniref:Tetratricopeptide repeat protein n=1 Tax=Pseudolysobacter antarcticus TaxID=2511995 RepID=A0A411HIA6_9GAMM|nr:serine/threonine-protein kinase [Pseudolysobacter antarcticus]QBB70130.1 tetratricopeptide repeat protein [Pseudolysobacter antarcticus]
MLLQLSSHSAQGHRRLNIDDLLDPGSLFKSALFGTLLRDHVDSAELAPGTRVGPYRIERALGRGGMGIVYLGIRADGQFEQRVAIKFLARRVMASQIHDDFRRERQILASLNHAHIAHLLDGGVMDDGRLWFAVELIEGLPIDRHCIEKKLGLRDRVALMIPVIAAVQHAHSRLLLHRDIKPDNVLVGKESGAKLLDFGVAAFIDENDAATAYTPGYASPEQLAGERIGTSSDIWQLGNLLRVVASAHAEGEVPPRIPVDLQAIISRACAPRIAHRYHTAQGLHDELGRFLDHLPVRARDATFRYRFARFARRHPFSIAISALAAMLLAGVIAVDWRLDSARTNAQEEHALTALVTRFLTNDLIGEADPFGGGAHAVVNLGNMLSKASERSAITFAKHPHLASEVDRAIADALQGLSRYPDARKITQRGLSRLDPANPENFDLIISLKVLNAELTLDAGNTVDSRRELDELHAQVVKTRGELAPLALHIQSAIGLSYSIESKLVECEQVMRPVVAHAHELQPIDSLLAFSVLAQCSARLGHYDEALRMINAQLRSTIALYGEADPRTLIARDVKLTVAVESGDYANAVIDARALIEKMRTAIGSDQDVTAGVLSDAGVTAICAGYYDEAIVYLEESKKVHGKNDGERSLLVAKNLVSEGLAYKRLGDLQAAEHAFELGAAILKEHPDDNGVQTALLKNRGELRLAQNRYNEAAADLGEALDYARKINAEDHPRVATIKLGLAAALAHLGQNEAARSLMTEAAPVMEGRPSCWQPLLDAAHEVLPTVGVSPRQ